MGSSEDYKLIRSIGIGVAGPVYLAETAAGQVAIRQFESQASAGSEEWNRERECFLDAGRRWQNLRHPNIVPILEVIDEAGEAFVEMEYQVATTLQSELAARQFTPEEANAVLRKIGLALDFAHQRGVIHGDLKPSNIFLWPDGAVKVSDFAISPRGRRNSRIAFTSSWLHAYLSPEHLEQPTRLTAQSDQYSLGVIAYRMYTGQLPYANTGGDLAAAILHAEIPPPAAADPQLSTGVNGPILRALDRDPRRRFSSCLEFSAFLEASIISEPEPGKRFWPSSLLYAGLGVLGLALFFLLGHQSGTALRTTTRAEAPASHALADHGAGQEPTAAAVTPTAKPARTKSEPAIAGKPSPMALLREQDRLASATAKPLRRLSAAAADPRQPGASAGGGSQSPTAGDYGVPGAAPAETAQRFAIEIFSRDNPIPNGLGFSANDPTLGELAHGDLRARVRYNGAKAPKGKLELEWFLDNVRMDKATVAPNQLVEYGNEPTAGIYVVRLRVDDRPVLSFTFRIAP